MDEMAQGRPTSTPTVWRCGEGGLQGAWCAGRVPGVVSGATCNVWGPPGCPGAGVRAAGSVLCSTL